MEQIKVKIGKMSFLEFLKTQKGLNSPSTGQALLKLDFKISKKTTAINLAFVTVEELMLEDRSVLEQVYERAGFYEYELCPPEIVMAEELLSHAKISEKFLNIAMKPIRLSFNCPIVFRINPQGIILSRMDTWKYRLDDIFVFKVPS